MIQHVQLASTFFAIAIAVVGILAARLLFLDAARVVSERRRTRLLATTIKRLVNPQFLCGYRGPRQPYLWVLGSVVVSVLAVTLALLTLAIFADGTATQREIHFVILLASTCVIATLLAVWLHRRAESYQERLTSADAYFRHATDPNSTRRTSRDQVELRSDTEARNGLREEHDMSNNSRSPPTPRDLDDSEQDQLTSKGERLRMIDAMLRAWKPHTFDSRGSESVRSVVQKWRRKREEEKRSRV